MDQLLLLPVVIIRPGALHHEISFVQILMRIKDLAVTNEVHHFHPVIFAVQCMIAFGQLFCFYWHLVYDFVKGLLLAVHPAMKIHTILFFHSLPLAASRINLEFLGVSKIKGSCFLQKLDS